MSKALLEKVKRYKELQAMLLEIEVEMTALKEEFTEVLRKANVDELLIDVYKISVLQYTKNIFDKQKFLEKHEKMYNNYCYQKDIKSVVVK